ncbi:MULTISPECIES: hypothetical protein [unclassified Streptomyces]|uniref:hypothetical protein n=1 Tax=unclassified Streptomyces TaxID=2593676 RepID=UPI00131A8E7B|nr:MULTISPECIES: hypothetical protein [unclassified Streptomyces]
MNRWDEDGAEIASLEWESAVAADPTLAAEALHCSAGRVVAKYPSDALIVKMCQVAGLLGARVQGDDGEHYGD